MQITITAGKGGTGKTTVATNLALAIKEKYQVQFIDCDVEEPDSHIFLRPELKKREPVYIRRPEVDEDKCNFCRKCSELCQFNSIAVFGENILVYPELCHGCGLCSIACPNEAIAEKEDQIGFIETGICQGFQFLQGELDLGEPMATPVIRELKRRVISNGVKILDSPPGTACSVIETISSSDFALLVTEPTPFGLHDLKLTVEVCAELKVPCGVVINRDGIGYEKVDEYCRGKKIPVLLRIPDRKEIAVAYSNGIPFVEEMPQWKNQFLSLFESIETRIGRKVTKK